MSRVIALTQRVVVDPRHGERRDALDQRWVDFLAALDMLPLVLPNQPRSAVALMETVGPAGLVLTGGNSLACCGGDAPERDATEHALLDHARSRGLPVLGVCRGMQFLLVRFGATLVPVSGHAGTRHGLVDGRQVNSYHDFAARDGGDLLVTALADDGVVEAVQHPHESIRGIMWHPERCQSFDPADQDLFRTMFAKE